MATVMALAALNRFILRAWNLIAESLKSVRTKSGRRRRVVVDGESS